MPKFSPSTPRHSSIFHRFETREDARVRRHDDFTPDNDPHGDRDFGAIDLEGLGRVFWKIDYYDPTLTFGSEDPADPTRTRRVLTIMLADEY